MLLLRAGRGRIPHCSVASSLLPGTSKTSPQMCFQQRRQLSEMPPTIAPLFHYAADCNITQGIQMAMEGLHSAGVPWAATFVASGLALRLLTAPLHIYAEKLFAKRMHAQNFFTQGILKKMSDHYKVKIAPNASGTQLELQTSDPNIKEHTSRVLNENLSGYLSEHKLQASRIQNLKMCSIPVWLFSSFALRNVISSDFHPSVTGGLWIPDLLVPDPYCILPIAVGLFGFLNLWSQRKIYPIQGNPIRTKAYDATLAFFTTFAVYIMMQLPACIPLYWLIVSSSGMAQAQMLRHPRIKKLFGINRLPTDSATPLRDLFLTRKV